MPLSRTTTRRCASHLPDGFVILCILLIALTLTCLVMAAISLVLTQLLRLAGDDERWIRIIEGIILAIGIVLALPLYLLFSWIADMLEPWVGTPCPSCRQRELEWRSGSWKYGDPPEYKYFMCANCGAGFRQLWGGKDLVSELERARLPEPTEPSEPE